MTRRKPGISPDPSRFSAMRRLGRLPGCGRCSCRLVVHDSAYRWRSVCLCQCQVLCGSIRRPLRYASLGRPGCQPGTRPRSVSRSRRCSFRSSRLAAELVQQSRHAQHLGWCSVRRSMLCAMRRMVCTGKFFACIDFQLGSSIRTAGNSSHIPK